MKKTAKRILCSALALAMCSVLVLESTLRMDAEPLTSSQASSASASFTDVTGKYDTSKLKESYFNDSVLETKDTAPKYETRTVMITLDGEPLADRAKGMDVSAYLGTWAGEMAKSDINTEQTTFLKALDTKGIPYTLNRRFDTVVNAVAVEVNTKYVSTIKKMKGVDSAVITTAYAEPQTVPTAETSGVVLNETDVYETGIYNSSAYTSQYGAGAVVAVLDTGLDYTHPAFQSFQTPGVTKAWDRSEVKSKLEDPDFELSAEVRSGSLDVADVYMSDKVPYAYDYADDDPDVYPSYSNHGTHVAGIIGGYDPSGYTDKDGNPITDKKFLGVVPDCQLVICKVFTDDLDDPDLGGAVAEDIVAALDDCVKLGVDVINMSLGTSCGFTTTDDGDSEGEMLDEIYKRISQSGISLICAASNDYSAGYGGVYGTNLTENPDAGTVGSPSTYAGALSVASINGQKAKYLKANPDGQNEAYVFFEESRDINGNPFDFVKSLQELYGKKEFEYVVVPGVGHAADYTSAIKRLFKDANGNPLGRVALIKRGDTTFEEKVKIAMEMGAAGVIVYNNVAGSIRMNLGEIDNPVPAISITMNAGASMVQGAVSRIGTFGIDDTYAAGPFMSEFSSWGPTPDLKLKPEITAHGGEITSAVPGGYGEQSGTSMATPNMAGFMAVIRSYIKQELGDVVDVNSAVEINRLAMQLTMSTAGTVYDQDGLPYSPRKQGAGVAKMENIVDPTGGTKAYLYTENADNDYRPKLELGDDPDRTGEYTLTFWVRNFSATESLTFAPNYEFMTETLSRDELTVAEQAHMLDDSTAIWSVGGHTLSRGEKITVGAGEKKEITVVLKMGSDDRRYIEDSFENGMYVEGFLKLTSETENQCDLSIPFLGFYGDWDDAPMLDYSAYEVAENEQDASVPDDEKIKASVWATQPYNMYYNEKYVLPMGGYLYQLPDDAEPMYVDEEHNAVSRYNEYYGEGDTRNYLTTTGIKAVYTGLLRNARVVKYRLYDEATGELLIEDEINRVSKAYAGGGSAVPANVELEMSPEEEGLVANGKYRMEFEFYREEVGESSFDPNEDTFSFSFTVDYEAPVMQDARVRFYNYKDGNKEKQRIYLDVDVFDNHYVQTMLLCYPKTDSDGDVSLQLATEYPTPVRDAVKNGVTTVSIEITDLYEKYGDQLYIQLDDYALNTCLYQININNANAQMLPEGDEFGLAAGQENVTVDIYGTHKSALVYSDSYKGEANISNFLWTSANPRIANVKNGEIVGMAAGTTKVFVSNRKGETKTINFTVTDSVSRALPKIPSVSLGVIQTDTEALQKASGVVSVSAGKLIKMQVETDPWYHPMTDLKVVWSSSNEEVATVDRDSGEVLTIKKGTVIISATVMQKNAAGNWVETLYSATSIMQVQEEFTVSNYTLTDYNGLGYTTEDGLTAADKTLKIPTDMNIMYIGEEAFKDNNNIEKIIIPSSVIDIHARAFINCTALKEVYFVSDEKLPIADADVAMIYEQAFYGCINLEKVDFSNVKTVTVAADCFGGCVKLKEVVDMPSIGTMHHRAFAGTALESVDLTGLHMSGQSVFEGCQNLTEIKTGKFTAIGAYMFRNCLSLRNVITLHTPKIGEGAFSECVNLRGVVFESPYKVVNGVETAERESLEFDIGARAFENCGQNAKAPFTVTFGTEKIRSLGDRAFAGSTLQQIGRIKGLEVLGADVFVNTGIKEIMLYDDLDLQALRLMGVPFNGITVKVAPGCTKYTEVDGVIYADGGDTLVYVNESKTGELTVNAEHIGAYAFANSNLSKVTIGENVRSIGVGAFKNAKTTSVVFAANTHHDLVEIPESAFEGSALTGISLPSSITRLGERAFASSSLASFSAAGLESIGSYAFAGCKALTSIVLDDDIQTMGAYVFANCITLESVTLPSFPLDLDGLNEAERLEQIKNCLGEYTFYGAEKLKSVTFGDGALTTGKYTFAGTSVEEVILGGGTELIDEGAFYQCESLKEIQLPASVKTVEALAFSECISLSGVVGIDNVESFGDMSFYNTALPTLPLSSAKNVGYMAFAIFEAIASEDGTEEEKASYETVYIPVVETISDFAFFNSDIEAIELPKTLQKVGAGAFASCDNLKRITVDSANERFFVEDGVLYRYTKNEALDKEYELVCYPTALAQEGAIGERTYTVKDGTVRIQAYAFSNLNSNMVNKVILPYSLNAIGDSAFFVSGIEEYTFNSIVAPTLETSYRTEIRDAIKEQSTIAEYKGYYYNNFQTYLYHFTKYGGQTSEYVMHYPSNGSGYNNPIYTMYFGVRTPSASPLMEDNTRECIKLVEKVIPDVNDVADMLSLPKTEENTSMVQQLSENIKAARIYYNNAMANAGQKGYITQEVEEKLLAAEREFRAVKQYFNIPLVVQELRIAGNSTHKTEYSVGDTFDMNGLSLILVYDDYSTETANPARYKLLTTTPLGTYNKYVEVRYENNKVRVPVTVLGEDEKKDTVENDDSVVLDDTKAENSFNVIPYLLALAGVVAVVAVIALIVKSRQNKPAKKQAVRVTARKEGDKKRYTFKCD